MYQEQQHKTLLQLEHAVGKLGALAQGSTVSLQEELQKIEAKESSEKEAGAGKFSSIPSDFQLSYGRWIQEQCSIWLYTNPPSVHSQEDNEKGLAALVGAPVANAAQLEMAVKHEHER